MNLDKLRREMEPIADALEYGLMAVGFICAIFSIFVVGWAVLA
jgi:hypothetical protein